MAPALQELFGHTVLSFLWGQVSRQFAQTASPPVSSPELAHHFFLILHVFFLHLHKSGHDPSASWEWRGPLSSGLQLKAKANSSNLNCNSFLSICKLIICPILPGLAQDKFPAEDWGYILNLSLFSQFLSRIQEREWMIPWWKLIKKLITTHTVFISFLLPGIPIEGSHLPLGDPLWSQWPNGATHPCQEMCC